MIRVDPDDDDITLGEMLRQEKFGAGMADQKNLDAEFARAVMTDSGFQVRSFASVALVWGQCLTRAARTTWTTSTTTPTSSPGRRYGQMP